MTDNLIIEHLKTLRTEIAAVKQDTGEIKALLTNVENGIATIRRDEAGNYSEIIENRHLYDKLAERIQRIERRLEIAE